MNIEIPTSLQISAAATVAVPAAAAIGTAAAFGPDAALFAGTGALVLVLALAAGLGKVNPLQVLLLIGAAFVAAGVAGAKEFFGTLLGGEGK